MGDNQYMRIPPQQASLSALVFCLVACGSAVESGDTEPQICAQELIILGTGQDAGAPQIGYSDDPAWTNPDLRLTATSMAFVDHETGERFLFEATPDITEQLQRLDVLAPSGTAGLGLDGVFLTHAHIGHYAGLMYFGREAAGASDIPVYLTQRFADYLSTNGPWEQLVSLGNISLMPLSLNTSTKISDAFHITPLQVPHRDEYSDTVAYLITTQSRSALFVPDIDRWDTWNELYGHDVRPLLEAVDFAFVDATFFDDNELPGRDMSEIPHPRVTETMAIFADAPAEARARIQFIHTNHTNPIRDPASAQSRQVLDAGFGIARPGDRYCLSQD